MVTAQKGQFSASFGSIDKLSEAMGYDLDFRQLESGPLMANVSSTAMGSVVCNDFSLDRAFHQRGKMPDEIYTFGFMQNASHSRWAGKDIGPFTLLDFNSRNGFDVRSNSSFAATILHVDQRQLEDTAEGLGINLGKLGIIEFSAPLPTDHSKLECLHSTVATTKVAIKVRHKQSAVSNSLLELEADIYRIVAECLGNGTRDSKASPPMRLRALRRSIEFIDAHLRDALTICDICRASSTSIRTLQRVFLEELGISPKRYIKLAKLAQVQKQLTRQGDPLPIGEIAHSWGFWHLGQFAQDYRREFGELPSETRRNAAQNNFVPI